MWMYLIHLDLNFVWGDKYGSLHILVQLNIKFDQHHLLNMLASFPTWFFLSLCHILGVHCCMSLCLELQLDTTVQSVSFTPIPYLWCSIGNLKWRYCYHVFIIWYVPESTISTFLYEVENYFFNICEELC